MLAHIVSVIVLQKFETSRNKHTAEISEPHLERLARAHLPDILYKLCFMNVLKYSDFIFYVATKKNNKFDFPSIFDELSKYLYS